MDLRQLRYFVVLAEELHFRRAAERLNITQAPLSIAIQNLERELGGQLFLRTQRRVALSEVGAVFREHALAVLDRLERGVGEVRELVAGEAGVLRVGFTAAAALLPFFPRIISTYRGRYPKVRLTLHDLSSVSQLRALAERAIDVGILRGPGAPPPSGLTMTKLIEDQLVLAMNRDHPLSAREAVAIADLRGEPLIFYPPKAGIGLYEQFIRACAAAGFAPTIVQEATDPSTIVGLAATGLGLGIVPAELQCIDMPNIRYRPLAGEGAVTGVYLAARSGEASALVARFRHLAMAMARDANQTGDPIELPEPTGAS